jgi:hypothetical protein
VSAPRMWSTECACGVRFIGRRRKRCERCNDLLRAKKRRDKYVQALGKEPRAHHCGWCGEVGHYEPRCPVKERRAG